MKQYSLQRLFILPFVMLMLCLAATIGWFLYRAGQDATDAISQKALADLMSSIDQATERQLHDAKATLRVITLAPMTHTRQSGPVAKAPSQNKTVDLQERLWIASSLFSESSRSVCFGGVDGQFVGIRKIGDKEFLMRVRGPKLGPSSLYRTNGPNGVLTLLRTDEYEPRTRAWYINALKYREESWSPVIAELRSNEPAMLLAREVTTPDDTKYGVAATEMPLRPLSDFLRSMPIEKDGLAFIAERNGDLVASSTNDNVYEGKVNAATEESYRSIPLGQKAPLRRNVSTSTSSLMRMAWQSVQPQLMLQKGDDRHLAPTGAARARPPMITAEFSSSSLGRIEVAARVYRDAVGLDWVTVVATPRSDFWNSVNGGIYHSLLLGLTAILITMVLGFVILRWALRDIRKLTLAAQNIGSGEPFTSLDINRKDEIGQLAQSFQEMERSLRTDRLTNLLNRDSMTAQIEFMRRKALDPKLFSFALLFIDLNKFKGVNDQFGHEQGDRVLIEVAQRLQHSLRKDDAVARFGGDEFVVYLDGVSDQDVALAICQKIIAVLEKPIEMVDGTRYSVGASIGGALYPADGVDLETLLRVADSRMYSMKKFGSRTD